MRKILAISFVIAITAAVPLAACGPTPPRVPPHPAPAPCATLSCSLQRSMKAHRTEPGQLTPGTPRARG